METTKRSSASAGRCGDAALPHTLEERPPHEMKCFAMFRCILVCAESTAGSSPKGNENPYTHVQSASKPVHRKSSGSCAFLNGANGEWTNTDDMAAAGAPGGPGCDVCYNGPVTLRVANGPKRYNNRFNWTCRNQGCTVCTCMQCAARMFLGVAQQRCPICRTVTNAPANFFVSNAGAPLVVGQWPIQPVNPPGALVAPIVANPPHLNPAAGVLAAGGGAIANPLHGGPPVLNPPVAQVANVPPVGGQGAAIGLQNPPPQQPVPAPPVFHANGPHYIPVVTQQIVFFRGARSNKSLYYKVALALVLVDLTYFYFQRYFGPSGIVAHDIAVSHMIGVWGLTVCVCDYLAGWGLIPKTWHKLITCRFFGRGFPNSAHDGFSYSSPIGNALEYDDAPDHIGNRLGLLSAHGYTHWLQVPVDEHVVRFVLAKRSGSQVIGNDNLQRFILSEITTEFPTVPLGVAVNCASRTYQILLSIRALEDLTTVPARGGVLPRVTW